MANIDGRLRRVEAASGSNETMIVSAMTEEGMDRQAALLRQRGFIGHIERMLIRYTIVSPPPRDEAGNIVGPAPPPYLYEPDAGT